MKLIQRTSTSRTEPLVGARSSHPHYGSWKHIGLYPRGTRIIVTFGLSLPIWTSARGRNPRRCSYLLLGYTRAMRNSVTSCRPGQSLNLSSLHKEPRLSGRRNGWTRLDTRCIVDKVLSRRNAVGWARSAAAPASGTIGAGSSQATHRTSIATRNHTVIT